MATLVRYRGFTLLLLTGGIWIVSGLLPARPFPSREDAQCAVDRELTGAVS